MPIELKNERSTIVEKHWTIDHEHQVPFELMKSVYTTWQKNAASGLPQYSDFDVTQLSPEVFPHLLLIKTRGEKRRFFYELIGSEVDRHVPKTLKRQYLKNVPFGPKFKIARELVRTKRLGMPICLERKVLGNTPYIKSTHNLITPYERPNGHYAFVCVILFKAHAADEWRLKPIG